MPKNIKLFYYTKEANLGDLLNAHFNNLFSNVIIQEEQNIYTCESVFIGSLMQCFFSKKTLRLKIKYFLTSLFYKPLIIWGSGFLKEIPKQYIAKRRFDIRALRGKKTQQLLETLSGKKMHNVTLGDPGILAELLVDKKYTKIYKVGIVPHYAELTQDIFQKLANAIPKSILINPQDNCLDNLKKIYQCECILSSALHGLIVADEMNIPNIRLIASDLIADTQFKFEDYYSAYNINSHYFIDIRKKSLQEILNLLTNNRKNDIFTTINENRSVSYEKVQTVKSNLLKSFPYKSEQKIKS
ncbi:polysaccharide pyruvyl transferase family protein [Campylobacter lari]|uniref:polysaccharide pyruvyl transferase family protein n=1 Tax=Campylobacter lari TaxID=201 RepID=UPI0008C9C3EB|nr:polysaccharide pyruvyl transferase family protein [Campylobacter lari]EAJ0333571.1 polysaccharide pyruvyl transferase family protein [Campylobacter lari]QKF75769.1 polysaccharide pyruvyl transferase [Campylobacter lari subsp. lari]QQT71449.1 polysaccharide pyruvyl transferase family protein [Campylobacter lari]TXE68807.1 polysaccharide pyruvyl transferase family protein [Campylobacter lari]SET13780.1 Polysaccharide pyruvyl transferase [Campylobacter lari subsp. lari]